MSTEHLPSEARKTMRLKSKGRHLQLEEAPGVPEWETWSANKDNRCTDWNRDGRNSVFMMIKRKARWSPWGAGN